jgi:hypothetical protein
VEPPEPDRRGFWIRGDIGALDADAWLLLKEQLDAGTRRRICRWPGSTFDRRAQRFRSRVQGAAHRRDPQTGEWQPNCRAAN